MAGLLNHGSLRAASWFSRWHPLSNWLQLTRTVWHLVILLFNVDLLPLFFPLFTQMNLLIDGSVEGQYITHVLQLFKLSDKIQVSLYLFTFFYLDSMIHWNDKIHSMTSYFLANIKSVFLAGIGWYVPIWKILRNLRVSFFVRPKSFRKQIKLVSAEMPILRWFQFRVDILFISQFWPIFNLSYWLTKACPCTTQSAWAAEYTDCFSTDLVRHLQRLSLYNTKQSDREALVILELWGMRSASLLPSLPGLVWPGVEAS